MKNFVINAAHVFIAAVGFAVCIEYVEEIRPENGLFFTAYNQLKALYMKR